MAIDASRGLLFWLDRGSANSPPKLARVDLDGTHALVVVANDISEMDFVTLDIANQRIYFSEGSAGRVSACVRC
jgi:low density lipoprotein-related protein 2